MGFQTLLVAFLADLQAANRRLIEDVRFQLRTSSDQNNTIGNSININTNPKVLRKAP
jgi:hypothetical protein